MSWIYLSKKGQDEYINRMAKGAGVRPTTIETWRYEDEPEKGLVLRGIMKHEIMKKCWADGRAFRYMDTGYFGNRPNPRNPMGWKWYHRIVDNNLQHDTIIPRPPDRWLKLGLNINPWRKDGRKIIIAVPDEKPCKFYGIDANVWLDETVNTIKKHTDRPVQIRHRVANADARTRHPETSFSAVLSGDTFAVVTFNSVAATEAILAGIPAFVTAPCNAARPVANLDLSTIADPWYPDRDLVFSWACHLAYGQFHNDELSNGTALSILSEYHS